MSWRRAAAAALAGGLAFSNPCSPVAPTTRPGRPPHSQSAAPTVPATQPASAPASRPALDEALLYRLTRRGAYDHIIADAALRWGLSPWLLHGLLWHESKLVAGAENENTGAAGVAQLTAGGRAAVSNLRRWRGAPATFTLAHALDPREAIPAAGELLAHHLELCGSTWGALAAFNTGKCGRGVQGFVRSVEKHQNRFRLAAKLPPEPPIARPACRPVRRHPPES